MGERYMNQILPNLIYIYRKRCEHFLRRSAIKSVEIRLVNLRNKKKFLQEQFLSEKLEANNFQEMKRDVDAEIYKLELELKDLNEVEAPFQAYIKEQIPMFENLLEYYRNSNGRIKKKILGCIFSKKIEFDENRAATYELKPGIKNMILISNSLQNRKIKKEVKSDLFSVGAPFAGSRITRDDPLINPARAGL